MIEANREIIRDILERMPEAKRVQLGKAMLINAHLTSVYDMNEVRITVYREGWYVEFSGTRCGVKIWAYDDDGEYVFGRKPKESKLHKLYVEWDQPTAFVDLDEYVK